VEGENSFVMNAGLMWKSAKDTGYYNHPLDKNNYDKWMKEKLILNLPPNSVIILDNMSYCNVLIEKTPSLSTKNK
jgi:hypothetical protein